MVDDISVLSRWRYNTAQQNLIKSRLGVLTGWGRTRLRSTIADLALPLVLMVPGATNIETENIHADQDYQIIETKTDEKIDRQTHIQTDVDKNACHSTDVIVHNYVA